MDPSRARDADLGFRAHTDEELARWAGFYRRRLALIAAEVPAAHADLSPDELADLIAGGRDFYTYLLGEIAAEEASRRRAATLGVARDAPGYPPAFLADLKARIRLDDLLTHELGARLGRPTARGVRRGWCPVCRPSPHSTALAVHVASPADQWFYCHRCGVSGDAYAAIQVAYGLSFREAVAKLAALGGVPLPTAAGASVPRPAGANRLPALRVRRVATGVPHGRG